MVNNNLKYFKWSEFDCPSEPGSGEKYFDRGIAQLLDVMRARFGRPIVITSAYRSQAHNAKIRGAPNSWHAKGKAVDIRCVDKATRYQLVALAFELGFKGIEICDRHIHLDMRDTTPICWTDKSK